MDLGYSESEQMIKTTAREFLERECPKSLVRAMEEDDTGYPRELWQRMAGLGWMGLIFPEEYGGSNDTFLALVLLIEEMGRALLPGPFIATVVCGGLPILYYGSEAQKEEYLPKIAAGDIVLTQAFIAPDLPTTRPEVEEMVVVKDGSYILSGVKLFAPYAHIADCLVYSSRVTEEDTLFLVDAKQSEVKSSVLPSIGSDKQCEVVLNNMPVSETNVLGKKGQGQEIIGKIGEWGSLAQCGFILGELERVLEMTVEYAKQRVQFNKPIGSFQSIQHQCADMVMDIDTTKFLTYQAAWKLSQQVPATKEISLAKARASDASKRVCLLGVKVHGGIGIMEDHDMSLYYRKAKAGEIAFGDGDFHREIVAQQLDL
ncbi:MAG: acyl-CoA dehydrogenase family protein [Chloroflexota bacterium]|nr:acyl-CoA dehydrogenase family protein [Chloroflexota bacterium]